MRIVPSMRLNATSPAVSKRFLQPVLGARDLFGDIRPRFQMGLERFGRQSYDENLFTAVTNCQRDLHRELDSAASPSSR